MCRSILVLDVDYWNIWYRLIQGYWSRLSVPLCFFRVKSSNTFLCHRLGWLAVDIMFLKVVRPSVRTSVCPSVIRGTTLRAFAQQKLCLFNYHYHACIAMPTWPRCAHPIYVLIGWLAGHITSSRGCPFNCPYFLLSIRFTDGYNFACSAQQKLCLFNKLSCMHCNANMT